MFRSNFESKEDRKERHRMEVLDIKDSFFNKHKNKNLYQFSLAYYDELKTCKNATDVCKKLYNLFYRTGHDKTEPVTFSEFTTKVFEFCGIDVKELLRYINYQKDLSESEIESQIAELEKKEAFEFTKFLIKLRDQRSKLQNKELNDYEKELYKAFLNKDGKFDRMELIKYANQQLFAQNISVASCV